MSLGSYFNNAMHSDFTVRCLSRAFKVHKVIISARSDYFRNACEGGFKEEFANEIDLSDDDIWLVDSMLQFMYTGSADVPDMLDLPLAVSKLGFYAALAGIADKYQVKELIGCAVKEFRYELFQMRYTECMDEMLNQIPTIYDALPQEDRRLRDPITNAIAREYALLPKLDVISRHIRDEAHHALGEAVKRHADFASDVVVAMGRDPLEFRRTSLPLINRIECKSCHKHYLIDEYDVSDGLVWDVVDSSPRGAFNCDDCILRLWESEGQIGYHPYKGADGKHHFLRV
ncbi:hypothetical protein NA57DRAFT_80280 [Rhizodiscina lignyota]|uniref:BTB domain-containing protein n=1 Tax=Rhizodiscina lignyota TaxID=1504668 RepID=A0A9P4I9G9_9PEZI|nr:hypothetical protein NA57DRAFT_80280 [Rhizodiscina lignyota]